MCLELTYANSEFSGTVEFAYLAAGDDIILDRSTTSVDDDGEEYIDTHGGSFDSHLWLQWCDDDNNKVLTALLSYMDRDEWEGSLSQQLVFLNNNNLKDELVSNMVDMFCDAMHNSGFGGTLIGKIIECAQDRATSVSWRTIDFQMHEPSKADPHPSFDT